MGSKKLTLSGLRDVSSWRTLLVGMLLGYVVAWGMHWATRLRDVDGIWWDEKIPYLTPHWGKG